MDRNNLPPTPQDTLESMIHAVDMRLDPLGMMTPILHAPMAWLTHPHELSKALARMSVELAAMQQFSAQRLAGLPVPDVEKPHPDDQRFADPVWTDSALWDVYKEWYLLFTHRMQDYLYETPGMAERDRRRAAFWWRKWLNAVAPTNFFWTNPVAQQKAIETRGESLRKGFEILMEDINANTVRMTDLDDFKVGQNLGTTPGKVVMRNELLEVIHYTPTTPKQHAVPVVIVTPWINKFYVLDLTPKKSMVKYLLDQGLSVFITSWKNPDASMRDIGFEDYAIDSIDAVMQCARSISGQEQVNAVGYCIGGAGLATYAAWANQHYGEAGVPFKSLTFFTTLVDYDRPGDIEVFLDEGSFEALKQSMEEKGYLDGAAMAAAFRLLRSNSLIWHYVVHGYLYGEEPTPFDVLYWNMDTTRMPARMHTWYLRNFYLDNKLIQKDALTLRGEPISLERIVQPVYAVSCEDDHVAPWTSTFAINKHVAGPKRYVLSTSGHILGIVNPVVEPPKRAFRAGPAERSDTIEDWTTRTPQQAGSWWTDWMEWLKPQSGRLVNAGRMANADYPALGDAPGEYVLEH